MDNNDKRLWVQTLWAPLEENFKSPILSCKDGIRVAAYARVSPGVKEDSHSLENQVHYFTLMIKKNPNWKFTGIYLDNQVSGMSYHKRRGLKRLIRHAEEGNIDLILTKSVSRFSRNVKETLELIQKLKELDVTIYFEKERIDTSQENSSLAIKVYAALAQEESIAISNAGKWAYQKKFMRGEPKYGQIFGYNLVKVNGKDGLVINEVEAKVIRAIYKMYLNGVKQVEIARQLIARGIKTSSGKDIWTNVEVKNVLTNITYCGCKLTRIRMRDIVINHESKYQRDQYLIEDCHPAIVSKEEYKKVQQLLESKRRHKKPFKKKEVRALSGRAYCGRCGARLNTRKYAYEYRWNCKAGMLKLCDFKSISESKLKEMMLIAYDIRYDIYSDDFIYVIQKTVREINENDYFEFHRLKYLTDIELARKINTQSTENETNLKNLLLEYSEFEEKIIKIEDDRKYRNLALEFLGHIKMNKEFVEKVEIEHMRALISEITIYSEEDYLVHWFDDKITAIGNCTKYGKEKLITEKIELYPIEEVAFEMKPFLIEGDKNKGENQRDEAGNNHSGVDKSYMKVGKEERILKVNPKLEVIPIEPGQAAVTMKNIHKGLKYYKSFKMPTVEGKEKTKIRVAAYCRVSTEYEEQQTSLKTQIAYYTYLIFKNPDYDYVGIYADEGLSGKQMDNRKELQRLLDDCRSGKVDLILTKSMSRFSRNVVDMLEVVQELNSLPNPTYIYFEKENINTEKSDSDLLISLYSSIAEEEIKSTSEAVAWGKRRLAERGIVPIHHNYGYIKEADGIWRINEEEAKVIRRIYQEVLCGKPRVAIAKDLGKDGIKSPTGKDYWVYKSVDSMLKNVIYKGSYLYQKTYVKNCLTGHIIKNKGDMPQYYIKNHHPAIIELNIWDQVQDILDNQKNYATLKHNDEHLDTEKKNETFENMYICGECGSKIGHRRVAERRYGEGAKYSHLWKCLSKQNHYKIERCNLITVRQQYLEWHLMKTLLDIKQNPECKNTFQRSLTRLRLSDKEVKHELCMQQELNTLNERLYKAVDTELNIKGQDTTLINELMDQIVKLKNQLREYENRKEKIIRYQSAWKHLQKDVEILSETRYKKFEKKKDDRVLDFLEKISERYILKGKIFHGGKIEYELDIGISWTISMTYDYFVKMKKDETVRNQEKKFEDILNTEDVDKLIEFCETPRKFMEIYSFMIAMNTMSESRFRVRYFNPLIEKGLLEKKLKDKSSSKNQRYYAVMNNKN
ncbi:recombinase family protein [Clostridium sp. DL1XJH146]